jgi:hypothetical protein
VAELLLLSDICSTNAKVFKMYTGDYLGDNYNPYEYAAEDDLYSRLESNPINIKGAIGIIGIVIGILILKS